MMIRLLVVVALSACALVAQPIFKGPSNIPINTCQGPFYSVAADFNNDGNLDVAFICEGGSPDLTILLGDGHGGFMSAPTSPLNAGAMPGGMIAADFNGDGKMDLAVESTLVYPSGGGILILLGDGTGGFKMGAGAPYLMDFVTGFGVGDFNKDGLLDVAVSANSALIILLGDGKGGLTRAPSPSGRGAVSGHVAVGDFTGNGNSDLAVTNSQGLTIFVSDGNAGFSALPIAPFTGTRILAADFNGDRHPDLLVGNAVLLNDGKGQFSPQTPLPFTDYSTQPYAIADFDGDGHPDLAFGSSAQVNILLGDGTGKFTMQTGGIAVAGPVLLAGDFDNDGKPDLMIADERLSQTFASLNSLPAITARPNAVSFQTITGQPAPKPIPVAISTTPGLLVRANQTWVSYSNGVVAVDPTGLHPGTYSATLNFTAPNYFGASVQVSLSIGAPSGTLTQTQQPPLPLAKQYFTGDFNNDGIADVLLNSGSTVTVWFGDGKGGFVASNKQTSITASSTLGFGDFNHDGYMDVAVVANSPQVQILWGDGSGGFASGPVTAFDAGIEYPNGFAPPLVNDFNLDGNLDISLTNVLLLGDGKGHFSGVPKDISIGQVSQTAATADLNGDGIPDLVNCQLAAPYSHVLLGDGKGGYVESQRFGIVSFDSLYPYAVRIGDFNNDGIPDIAELVTANFGPNNGAASVTIWTGKGNGTFTQVPSSISVPSAVPASPNGSTRPTSLQMADFDGDGNLDLSVSLVDNTSIVFLGDGRGGFSASPGGRFPNQIVAVADFNGDGRPDAATAGPNGVTIALGALAQPIVTLTQLPADPFTIGQYIEFAASVSAPLAFRAPTGQLALSDGATVVSTKPLAAITVFGAPFFSGTHVYSAAYLGDVRNAPATTTLTLQN